MEPRIGNLSDITYSWRDMASAKCHGGENACRKEARRIAMSTSLFSLLTISC